MLRKCLILSFCLLFSTRPSLAGPRLRVSENRRFLVSEDGRPFFYLGDTAWELFHRLNREEAEKYLRNRASLHFTVIQAVVLAELNGLDDPNPYGQKPLLENDPGRPNEEYFRHVDWIVEKANDLGLFIGMLPTWGNMWSPRSNAKNIFNRENAAAYGGWLGRRYKDKDLIWIMGGDRPADTEDLREILRAMAGGLREGDGGRHLITFHPPGGEGSSTWFHEESWLDFNMRQNGHEQNFRPRYAMTGIDYERSPAKPVMDGEPLYEDHPISFNAKDHGHSIAADVRRPLYWDLFSGAFGHTYGHHSVWQMWTPERKPVNNPLMPWYEAILQPGAAQMQHARALLESRPFLTRIPDDSIIVPDSPPTAVPGTGLKRLVATRDSEGSYCMVYTPAGRPFKVRMEVIKGPKVKAWWFNPRTGRAAAAGEYENRGEREFVSPDRGEMLDWILVLDDAACNFAAPGSKK
jgi:hypothetical protein